MQMHSPLLGKWKKGIRPLKWQESSSVLSQTGEGLVYEFLLFSPLYIVEGTEEHLCNYVNKRVEDKVAQYFPG